MGDVSEFLGDWAARGLEERYDGVSGQSGSSILCYLM